MSIAKQRAFIDLRDMKYRIYKSDHDFYEQLDKRLMPPGMEWPRFEDGKQITWDDAPEDIIAVCLALDGSCYSLHYDMPDERMCIYEVSERVKRPVTVVLGADGLPIMVGDTVYLISGSEPYRVENLPKRKDGMLILYGIDSKREKLYCYYPDQLTHTAPDTQERIDDDATIHPYEYCKKHCIQAGTPDNAPLELSDFVEPMALDLLRRQRELDARTMGCE